MQHIITEYLSKNGTYFHHSISTFQNDATNKPKSEFLPESHYGCEVLVLLSGSIKYKVEGQFFNLSSMDAIVIQPNKLHSIEIDPSQPYDRMVLHFSTELLPSFADLNLLSNYNGSLLPSFVIPKKLVKPSNLINLMYQCQQLCLSKNKYLDLRFVGIILQIIESLNEIVLNLNETNALLPIKVDKISHACIQYINQNLTDSDKLTPQHLAKELHISPSHLQHTFKKELGITLHSYIFNQRMQLARKLLLQNNPPQVVSNLLGFEYYSTFYHNFVKRFGSAPNSFTDHVQGFRENIDV